MQEVVKVTGNRDIEIYTHSDNHNVEIKITCNLMLCLAGIGKRV